ncbi:MAG: glycosyl hydrolase family 18 protein [Candidatus Nanopelagicales bacterium]
MPLARPSLRIGMCGAAAGLLLAGLLAPAANAETRRIVAGWLPAWDLPNSLNAVASNAAVFSEASPFLYKATAAGGSTTVTTETSADVVASTLGSLRASGVKVIPSLADNSAPRAMAAVLASPTSRAAHVAQVVELVMANGFDGIELDYEKFAFADGTSSWASTRPNWVAFVQELSAALHAQRKSLSVAVPPTYAAGQTSAAGYWVYDIASIANSIDSLRLMTYDYSVSAAGPIAPLSFVTRSLDYAVSVVPSRKVMVGIPAYGRVWTAANGDGSPAVRGTCPTGIPGTRSFTTTQAGSFLSAAAAGSTPTITWDETYGEATATFTRTYSGKTSAGKRASCTVTHVAWWMDARGLLARTALIERYKLGGIALWHLAGVDASTWTALQAYAAGQPVILPAAATETPSATPVVATPSATVTPTPTATPTATPSASVASPLPTASTPTATSATLVKLTAPASAKLGQEVTVAAVVTTGGAAASNASATLWMKPAGRKWTKVSSGRTSEQGEVSFSAAPRSSVTWRVNVSASGLLAAGKGRAATSVAPVLRVKRVPGLVKPNSRIVFTVVAKGAGKGLMISRQRLVDGAWIGLGKSRTNSSGKVTFTATPGTAATTYTYRFVSAATSKLAAATSAIVTVRTR